MNNTSSNQPETVNNQTIINTSSNLRRNKTINTI